MGKYKVLGSSTLAHNLASDGYDFIVGIGNVDIRERIQNGLIKGGCNVATLIHPNAEVAYNSCIGKGTVVMAGAVIESGTVIGQGCIINTSAVGCCDDVIGDFSHVSVGARLGYGVEIGSKAWIGIGTKVLDGVKICDGATVGAGALVDRDLEEAGTYVGVPVRRIK